MFLTPILLEDSMSLRKKVTMTEKGIVARRANGKASKGPATPAGRHRIREANTRHGLYSQAEAVALACLGEDPDDLARLRQNLLGGLDLPSAMEAELAEHLTQVVWRWKRAGRMQEGYALRLAKIANLTREDRLHGQMMRLKITAETLRRLAQSVARENYITIPADLEMMKNLHQEGAVKEMGEIALALFYQLQKPGTGEDGIDPEEKTRRAVNKFRSIFGLGPREAHVVLVPSPQQLSQQAAAAAQANVVPASSVAPQSPQVPSMTSQGIRGTREIGEPGKPGQVAGATNKTEGEAGTPSAEEAARERARQLLENILTRQVELCETQRKAIMKDSLAGPSPYERAAEIALAHPQTALMQRMEESSFRQIWRITTLLLKIKREARDEESREMPPRSKYVHERTTA
jgi:hypothetical protein